MRKELLQLATQARIQGNVDNFKTEKLLKMLYYKLDQHTLSEIKHFMSCVVAFSVSETIVKSWGSDIENVISHKTAFKEADSPDEVDMTEKVVFVKLVLPICWGCIKQKFI